MCFISVGQASNPSTRVLGTTDTWLILLYTALCIQFLKKMTQAIFFSSFFHREFKCNPLFTPEIDHRFQLPVFICLFYYSFGLSIRCFWYNTAMKCIIRSKEIPTSFPIEKEKNHYTSKRPGPKFEEKKRIFRVTL